MLLQKIGKHCHLLHLKCTISTRNSDNFDLDSVDASVEGSIVDYFPIRNSTDHEVADGAHEADIVEGDK